MACIALVMPVEANWWTQERTDSSKRRVSPASTSRPSQANKNRHKTAAARLAITAASNSAVGLGTSSGPATCVCGSDIGSPAAWEQRGNQLVQLGEQRLIAFAGIGRELFRIERQVEEKR